MAAKRKPGRPRKQEDERLKKLSVQLTDDELKAVEKIAASEERSVSYVIRRAVRQMLGAKDAG